jgi:uncharacterized protein (TIGR02996 family)
MAFLQDIREHPDDDAPRLVLADWLEERGDPRGELIRAQLGRTRFAQEERRAEWNEARRREAALLAEHAAGWLGPLADRVELATFARGLLQVAVPSRVFAGLAWAALARTEAYAWIETVEVTRVTDHGAVRLARKPQLDDAPALVLRSGGQSAGTLADDGAAALAESSHVARLKRLTLSGHDIRRAGALALAQSSRLGGLRLLDLSYHRINGEAWEALRERYGTRLQGVRCR